MLARYMLSSCVRLSVRLSVTPWELAKSVQLALIRRRPRFFQRAIDEPCTLPLRTPKSGTKRDFAVFARKIKLLSKEVCSKVSLCENVHRQSCSYIIPLSNGPQMDCGRRLKFALEVTHPFRKRRFQQMSLTSASAERASEKSSIITNRELTMRFPSSHRWSLCVTPKSPKGWLKTRIFTFGVAFHIFVAGNRRHFKFGVADWS